MPDSEMKPPTETASSRKRIPRRRTAVTGVACGMVVFLGLLVSDRIRAGAEVAQDVRDFATVMSHQFSDEAGDLVRESLDVPWTLKYDEAWRDQQELLQSFQNVMLDYDIPICRNPLVPTEQFRKEISSALRRFSDPSVNKKVVIAEVAATLEGVAENVEISKFADKYLNEQIRPKFFDPYRKSRESLVAATEDSLDVLAKLVNKLEEISVWNKDRKSIDLSIEVSDETLDKTIILAKKCCQQSRIAFVLMKVSETGTPDPMRTPRFIDLETRALETVKALAASRLLDRDGYAVVARALNDYARHMDERLDAYSEESTNRTVKHKSSQPKLIVRH